MFLAKFKITKYKNYRTVVFAALTRFVYATFFLKFSNSAFIRFMSIIIMCFQSWVVLRLDTTVSQSWKSWNHFRTNSYSKMLLFFSIEIVCVLYVRVCECVVFSVA